MKQLLVVLALVLLAHTSGAVESDEIVKLRDFLSVQVSDRLDQAIARNDYRPLGVNGFTLRVPGSSGMGSMRVGKDVLVIPGTSDAILSQEHGRLNIAERTRPPQQDGAAETPVCQRIPPTF